MEERVSVGLKAPKVLVVAPAKIWQMSKCRMPRLGQISDSRQNIDHTIPDYAPKDCQMWAFVYDWYLLQGQVIETSRTGAGVDSGMSITWLPYSSYDLKHQAREKRFESALCLPTHHRDRRAAQQWPLSMTLPSCAFKLLSQAVRKAISVVPKHQMKCACGKYGSSFELPAVIRYRPHHADAISASTCRGL